MLCMFVYLSIWLKGPAFLGQAVSLNMSEQG